MESDGRSLIIRKRRRSALLSRWRRRRGAMRLVCDWRLWTSSSSQCHFFCNFDRSWAMLAVGVVLSGACSPLPAPRRRARPYQIPGEKMSRLPSKTAASG
jgi:hypothetical protein